jgi:glycosyltransferase involved in cell wall biosynthesis
VIASDLPGVRQPVRSTGMGLIVQPQDSKALAQALIEVLHQPDGYRADQEAIKNRFSPAQVAVAYEGVFARLLESRRS